MSVKHVGKAQQERESRDSNNKAMLELIACIAAIAMLVACAIALFMV